LLEMSEGEIEPNPIVVASAELVAATGLAHKTRIGPAPDAPLIILVHGRAGNYDVMWTFRRAIGDAWNAIAPQAPVVDPIGGNSWWEVKEGSRGEPDAMQAAATQLTAFMVRAISTYRLTPRTVLALGFSQGAGIISIVLQRPAQPFTAVGLLAGFVIKNANAKTNSAGKLNPCPIQMCHGERDEVVPYDLAVKGAEHLRTLGFSVTIASDPVGHKIGPAGVRALKAFLFENAS